MTRAFIGLGSNIEPASNVRAAILALDRLAHPVRASTVYLTEALGDTRQPPYYNCVAEIAIEIPPREIKFGLLRVIEDELGRKRTADRYAPRTIDLDLIVYGDLALDEDGLRLPDPDILKRPFLAVPLFELAPDLVLAGYDVSIGDVAARMPREGMQPLEDYTTRLRAELSQYGLHASR
jgi:dihydroneopterin aldolase/2-amino-4-hydroxy-6-hydroxymethyldihydropteridine diphosphokinase